MTIKRPDALFLTQSFPPETHAGANRAHAMATALANHCDLTVVAPAPSHPTPDRFDGMDIDGLDTSHGFEVVRSSAFTPHAAGYLRRGALEICMAARLMTRRLSRFDTIIATSPSFFLGPMAYAFARTRGSRFVWDLRDLTWIYASEGLKRGSERRHLRLAAARLVSGLAAHTLRHADVVVASNDGIAAAAHHQRSGKKPVIVAPNGIDSALHRELAPVAAAKPSGDPVRVTYAGALGYFQALNSLLDAARMLPEVDFVLAGDGPERTHLESQVQSKGITNVTFTGYLSRSDLLDLYRESDILFAQLRDLQVMSEATLPSKVFEYLATGRPIVYAGSGITADLLRNTDAAIIAEPENSESIRQAIAKIAGDSVLREDMGVRGRAASNDHIREHIAAETAEQIYAASGNSASMWRGSLSQRAPLRSSSELPNSERTPRPVG